VGTVADERIVVHDVSRSGDRIDATISLPDFDANVSYELGGVEAAADEEGLAVLLVPIAMSRGWAIEVPAQVSPRLRSGIATAQEILGTWYPGWQTVDINARSERVSHDGKRESRGAACFFSGGVDSFYSVLRHREQLSALIFVHGFDVLPSEAGRRREIARSLRTAAEELGLDLVEVRTDIKLLTRRYCRWGPEAHGAALASIGLQMPARFETILIPASHSYRDLDAWGSHPILDPCWSSDAVEFVHEGPIPRTQKMATIAESDAALRHLRVCYQKRIDRPNCGRCEKCLRTMIGLHLVGALERCATLPNEIPLRDVAMIPIKDESTRAFAQENLEAAEAAGETAIARALRIALRVGPRRARLGELKARLDRPGQDRLSTLLARRRRRRRARRSR